MVAKALGRERKIVTSSPASLDQLKLPLHMRQPIPYPVGFLTGSEIDGLANRLVDDDPSLLPGKSRFGKVMYIVLFIFDQLELVRSELDIPFIVKLESDAEMDGSDVGR